MDLRTPCTPTAYKGEGQLDPAWVCLQTNHPPTTSPTPPITFVVNASHPVTTIVWTVGHVTSQWLSHYDVTLGCHVQSAPILTSTQQV